MIPNPFKSIENAKKFIDFFLQRRKEIFIAFCAWAIIVFLFPTQVYNFVQKFKNGISIEEITASKEKYELAFKTQQIITEIIYEEAKYANCGNSLECKNDIIDRILEKLDIQYYSDKIYKEVLEDEIKFLIRNDREPDEIMEDFRLKVRRLSVNVAKMLDKDEQKY